MLSEPSIIPCSMNCHWATLSDKVRVPQLCVIFENHSDTSSDGLANGPEKHYIYIIRSVMFLSSPEKTENKLQKDNTMTTPKNEVLTPAELEDINSRVERVRGYLKQSTSAWLAVAHEIAAAKKNTKTLAFEKFINEAGITKSVADKLLIVGKCNSLYAERNLATVSTAEGWTVLYALATLETKQLQDLLQTIATDSKTKLTREVIFNFVNKKPLDSKRLIVASIEIDEAKMNILTSDKFSEVTKQIDALQRAIDNVNAGFVVKQRNSIIKTLNNRASANSESFLMQTAA